MNTLYVLLTKILQKSTRLSNFLFFQRPLELGADVAMHSLTKYINGHTDVIMGAAVTNNDSIEEKLRFLQNGTWLDNFLPTSSM